jgi:hypothetical protein
MSDEKVSEKTVPASAGEKAVVPVAESEPSSMLPPEELARLTDEIMLKTVCDPEI